MAIHRTISNSRSIQHNFCFICLLDIKIISEIHRNQKGFHAYFIRQNLCSTQKTTTFLWSLLVYLLRRRKWDLKKNNIWQKFFELKRKLLPIDFFEIPLHSPKIHWESNVCWNLMFNLFFRAIFIFSKTNMVRVSFLWRIIFLVWTLYIFRIYFQNKKYI